MTWFTPTDLDDRLPAAQLAQLSTGEGRPSGPDTAVIQLCLDRAEQEVRGVLSGRATLPDLLDPGMLRDLSLDLAVEQLFLRQPGEAAKLPEGWKDRVKRSRELLQGFVSGIYPIPVVPAVTRPFEALTLPSCVDGAFRDPFRTRS